MHLGDCTLVHCFTLAAGTRTWGACRDWALFLWFARSLFGLDTVPLLPEDLQTEPAEDELIGLLDGQRTRNLLQQPRQKVPVEGRIVAYTCPLKNMLLREGLDSSLARRALAVDGAGRGGPRDDGR